MAGFPRATDGLVVGVGPKKFSPTNGTTQSRRDVGLTVTFAGEPN